LLNFQDKNLTFGNGEAGELAVKLFNEITSIQYGEKEDSYGWLTYVEKVKESV
jgi:branched-chain amino acid aminotransferase